MKTYIKEQLEIGSKVVGLLREVLVAPVNTELGIKVSGEFGEKATLDRRNSVTQSSRPSEVRPSELHKGPLSLPSLPRPPHPQRHMSFGLQILFQSYPRITSF